MELRKIIVIAGPTGAGKSALALNLAQQVRGVIVNADSMQIYRRMNIGTAKPTPDETALVPHKLFDIIEPDKDFDAAQYQALADSAIAEAAASGAVPIVVGGTGFYLRALLYGLCPAPKISPAIRAKYRNLYAAKGAEHLHQLLQTQDPAMAERLHANDYVRVTRALEVLEAEGESLLTFQQRHGGFTNLRYNALQIGVSLPRNQLYDRIDQRVDNMLAAGLEDEVKALLSMGYTPELKSMGSIGYKEMAAYLNGEIDYAEMTRLIKRNTRNYAKRQLTWFAKHAGMVWLNPQDECKLLKLAKTFLN